MSRCRCSMPRRAGRSTAWSPRGQREPGSRIHDRAGRNAAARGGAAGAARFGSADGAERVQQLSLRNHRGADASVCRSVRQVDHPVLATVRPLHEDHVVHVARALPWRLGFEERLWEPRVSTCPDSASSNATFTVYEPSPRRSWKNRSRPSSVGTGGAPAPTVSEPGDGDRIVWRSRCARWSSQYVGRRAHRVERLEHGDLDVGLDPMHHGDAPVRQVEDDRILVPDALGARSPAALPVQVEAAVLEHQPVHADAPGEAGPRRGRFV